jgi:hypothetical protein
VQIGDVGIDGNRRLKFPDGFFIVPVASRMKPRARWLSSELGSQVQGYARLFGGQFEPFECTRAALI